jgi:hypothetical protein
VRSPSPFEAFNARALSPRDVAATFVPPSHFKTLSRVAHTLVVGPRGSGKTTLLKMLTSEALESWDHPNAPETREQISYTGVFVPTDVSWGRQLDTLVKSGLEPLHAGPIVAAAFSTSVLRALVSAVAYRSRADSSSMPHLRPHRRLSLSPEDEASLAVDAATFWLLPLRLASLGGLAAALSSRLLRLHIIAGRERMLGPAGRSERLAACEDLHLDLVTACAGFVDIVESRAPESRDDRWAFLFDELELAPAAIREQLLASMRSVDQRFLFKLSISPYSEDLGLLEDALGAMPGHDYEEVLLTYGHKEDSIAFSETLFSAVLGARQWPSTSPEVVLGKSEFETDIEEWQETGHAYSSGGRLGKRYRELARKDSTFSDYLVRVGVDVDSLEDVDPNRRAQTLRKVNALVVVRSTYRADDALTARTRRRLRSRKTPDLYRGAASLFAMLEGNPRWLIGIANKLLDGLTSETVPASRQSREVTRTMARFRSLLTTIPAPDRVGSPRRGLLPLLDSIGSYFTARVIIDDFNPDPPSTFTVDADAPLEIQEALGRALNAGAIIYVPDPDSAHILSSLRGKRFRLSYLFSPHYYLPIRLGRAVSLGLILRSPPPEVAQGQLDIEG